MEFINEAVLHAAGQWWIYPLLAVFFFMDGFVPMVVPSETLIVALACALRAQRPAQPVDRHGSRPLVGAIAGDNMAYMLGRKIGLERFRWMRKPKVQKRLGLGALRTRQARRRADLHRPLHPGGTAWPSTSRRHHGVPAPPLRHPRRLRLPHLGGLLGRHRHPRRQLGPRTTRCSASGIAIAFAIVLGIVIDHLLTWLHRWRDTRALPRRPAGPRPRGRSQGRTRQDRARQARATTALRRRGARTAGGTGRRRGLIPRRRHAAGRAGARPDRLALPGLRP